MPRRKAETSDFRTPDQRAEDDANTEVRWRCPDHGTCDEPIILGGIAYCPADPCSLVCVRAWRSHRKSPAEWNASKFGQIGEGA